MRSQFAVLATLLVGGSQADFWLGRLNKYDPKLGPYETGYFWRNSQADDICAKGGSIPNTMIYGKRACFGDGNEKGLELQNHCPDENNGGVEGPRLVNCEVDSTNQIAKADLHDFAGKKVGSCARDGRYNDGFTCHNFGSAAIAGVLHCHTSVC